MLGNKLIKAAAGNAAPAGYQIERSLRFNSADSAYLSRTPASAGNRKTWTWSAWVKRTGLTGVQQLLFGAGADDANKTNIRFDTDDSLRFVTFDASSATDDIRTTAVYRDVSAWYHIVVVSDTTQATASDRAKIYVNGVQVTSLQTSNYPTLNFDTDINTTNVHTIGRNNPATNFYFNGYLAEVHFVDGQALTPSDFGEFDTDTGVWKPKEYTGTYGTNGFYLPFSDNTNATTLGYDESGNNNDWTLNNFSVAAGAGNDSLVDTPTPYGTDTGAGGEVRGNYCTLNALANGGTLSNGNLQFTQGGSHALAKSTFAVPTTGLWYAEATVTTLTGGLNAVGFGLGTAALSLTAVASSVAGAWEIYASSSIFFNRNATQTSIAGTFAANDVIQIAIDLANSRAWVGKNNTWYDGSNGTTGDPATGANPTFTSLPSELFVICNAYANTLNANFGQRPFAYTAPSGFKALCTQNLPDPTVVQGDDYFNTVLYTGDGTTPQSITGVGFEPDMVWIKARSIGWTHGIFTKLNGIGAGSGYKYLSSNNTLAETDTWGSITFDSDGWTGVSSGYNGQFSHDFGASGQTFVCWNWNAGGSSVANTDGTISSTVIANPTAGFSLVSYTGNGSTSPYPTVGHGLGVAPQIYIAKRRDNTGNWVFWHTLVDGSLDFMYLNSTTANANSALGTVPTSTVMTVGGAEANTNTATHIAYCFAEVEGFSKFGKYTANASTDGPFIYCGFRPAWVMFKKTNSTGTWFILDSIRDSYNVVTRFLEAQDSDAEASSQPRCDFVSNGIKIRTPSGYTPNETSGDTYIFMAFAENPFKYSLAR